MKTNTTVSCLLVDGVTRADAPAYRVPGCFFVVRQAGEKDFIVSDPNTGACIAHCNYFQTACRFANMLHDLICDKLPQFSKAGLEESKQMLLDAKFGSFYHLRLCKPGQFDKALQEQRERCTQLALESQAPKAWIRYIR